MRSYLNDFIKKMELAGLDKLVIQSFTNFYYKVLEGATGKLTEAEIEPPSQDNLIDYNQLEVTKFSPLDKLAVIKLNGGLGTSMGLKKAKTLLKIKGELNFLDVIAQQILHLRKSTGKKIPLLFMHSFNTQKDSITYLEKYPDLPLSNIPLDFLQNKFPKIKQSDLSPLANKNDKLNWNPPGHGEIYMALSQANVIQKLLDNGFEYAFISNSDNLGAIVDKKILNYFAEENIPFLMEVCRRSTMDKKGGHLAQTKDGQLLLRESAQCPDDEVNKFQDIQRYKYFNTNNLWINLKALKQRLYEKRYHLPLSMILNSKVVEGIKVYQVETAMGAAISVFNNSKAMIVNRDRFAPVKKTNDLLTVLSDSYELTEKFELELVNKFNEVPNIELEEKYYKNINDFDMHFENIPSLKECKNLFIKGEVYFSNNVSIKGDVSISKAINLSDIVLEDEEV